MNGGRKKELTFNFDLSCRGIKESTRTDRGVADVDAAIAHFDLSEVDSIAKNMSCFSVL